MENLEITFTILIIEFIWVIIGLMMDMIYRRKIGEPEIESILLDVFIDFGLKVMWPVTLILLFRKKKIHIK